MTASFRLFFIFLIHGCSPTFFFQGQALISLSGNNFWLYPSRRGSSLEKRSKCKELEFCLLGNCKQIPTHRPVHGTLLVNWFAFSFVVVVKESEWSAPLTRIDPNYCQSGGCSMATLHRKQLAAKQSKKRRGLTGNFQFFQFSKTRPLVDRR